MASLRDIRRQIGTVKNIGKITTAMKMVAAAKLRRAQERVSAARPYAEKMRELVLRVAPLAPAEIIGKHELLNARADKVIGLVVIASERGMCGSYNNNIVRHAADFVAAKEADGWRVEILAIGRRAMTALRACGHPADQHLPMPDVAAPLEEIRALQDRVMELYRRADDPVSEVWVAYAEFVNAVTQHARVDRFLPIEAGTLSGDEAGGATVEFEFEPDPEALLDVLLPRFVDNQVYQYLLEATASEYGARMTAMSTASENAKDMISSLTLQYNRARQDAITRELMDIVGGASALQGD